MNKQYYRVIGEKGKVELPKEIKDKVDIKRNDIVRICTFGNLVVMEKVNLKEKDICERLKTSVYVEQIPLEAFQCYVLTAIREMKKEQLKEIITVAEYHLKN